MKRQGRQKQLQNTQRNDCFENSKDTLNAGRKTDDERPKEKKQHVEQCCWQISLIRQPTLTPGIEQCVEKSDQVLFICLLNMCRTCFAMFVQTNIEFQSGDHGFFKC